MIPGKQYTPELVLATAWRRKWLIIIPSVVTSVIACSVIYTMSDQYRSETTILVIPPKISDNYIRSNTSMRVEDRLRSISQQVRSRTRLERIIEQFNLYPERRKVEIMQDIVEDMDNHIDVNIVQNDVFQVAFTGDHPRTVMEVTQALAAFFIDESMKDSAAQADDTSTFLDNQVEQAGARLRETEQKLVAYRRAHDGELPTQVDSNFQGISAARLQLQNARSDMERQRDLQLSLQRRLAELSKDLEAAIAAGPVAAPGATNSAAARLQAARTTLDGALAKLQPGHPDIARFKKDIAGLEIEAEKEAAQASLSPGSAGTTMAARITQQLEQVRADLDRVEKTIEGRLSEERRLNAEIAQFQKRLQAAPVRDAELVDLMRDYDTHRASYDSLLAKRIDSQMAADVVRGQRGEQFRVLDAARIPERPFSPDRPRLYMMAVMFAVVFGLVLAGGAEYLDRGLRSEDDVRLALALPVLASIPVIGADKNRKSRKLLAGMTATGVLAIAAVVVFWYSRG